MSVSGRGGQRIWGEKDPYRIAASKKRADRRYQAKKRDERAAAALAAGEPAPRPYRPKSANPGPVDWCLKRYGITTEARDEMSKQQGGRCLLCGEEKKLHVDHCHRTKKVRGLLCMDCNTGLGKFKDDPVLLGKAIAYVCNELQY